MSIYLNKLTFKVTKYNNKKEHKILQRKYSIISSNEICIGNDLGTINNPKYNKYLKGRLSLKHAKTVGCEIEFLNVVELVNCGQTNKRFSEQAT
jgi:hypothetical protein